MYMLLGHHLIMSLVVSCEVPYWGRGYCFIYVNEMAGAINDKILLYADNTAVLIFDKHVDSIDSLLRTALESISVWLIDNRLSLQFGKTESILPRTERKLSNCRNLNVSCNGGNIESKTPVKYLGASIDNCLSGDLRASKNQIVDWNFSIEMQSS